MNTETYNIFAMILRYVFVIVCFLVFVQAILESKKSRHNSSSLFLTSLEWRKGKIIYDLGQDNIVGRANKCDIVIKSYKVERIHGKIYLDSDEWIVSPYKKAKISVNKLLVEDKALLQDGDKISFGKESVIFHVNEIYDGDGDDE